MGSRRFIIGLAVAGAVLVTVIIALGVVVVSRTLSTWQRYQRGGWTSPEALRAEKLPTPGRYKAGLHGSDRNGNRAPLRGLVLAAHASPGSSDAAAGLAEALAIEGADLLGSLSVLPQQVDNFELEEFVPDREAYLGHHAFTREQALEAARQTGLDAVLEVRVDRAGPDGATASLELIDPADQSTAFTKELSGPAAADLVQALPTALKEVLVAAGLSLSPTDQALLTAPPYPAADYLRAGLIASLRPSQQAQRELHAFIKDQPDSPMARWEDYWENSPEWTAQRKQQFAEGWANQCRRVCPASLAAAAAVLKSSGQYPKAEALLTEFDRVKPNSYYAAALRQDVCWKQGPLPAAIALGRKLVEANPLSGLAWYRLGEAYWLEGSAARGGQTLDRITPQQRATFGRDVETGRACFERAAQLAPGHVKLLAELITLRVETGQTREAEQALDLCDAARPGYHAAYENMLWAYTAGYGNDPTAHHALLERADRQQPRWPWDEVYLAGFVSRLSADAAVRHYRRAADMAPDYFPQGWRVMANGILALNFQGADARKQESEALTFADACLDHARQQYPCLAVRQVAANVLLRRREYEGAEKELQGLLQEQPNSTVTLKLLAATQRSRGEWAAAEKTYRAAIKLTPGSEGLAQEWLAVYQCQALDGRQKEALAGLEEHRRKFANWYRAQGDFHLGTCYLAALAIDQAEGIYHAIAGYEREWGIMDNLGLCRTERGDWAGARKLFQSGHQLAGGKEFEPALGLAVCCFRLGASAEAFSHYDEAESLNYRSMCPEGLREQIWPPKAIAAFLELQSARQHAR